MGEEEIKWFFSSFVFTKEDGRQMPGTDINFPGVEDEILKKIRIMSDQVTEKLEHLKTDKPLQSD